MGLVIGVLAVVLVLILIFAMALAEWADKDLSEFVSSWFKRKTTAANAVAPVAVNQAGIPGKKPGVASKSKASNPKQPQSKRVSTAVAAKRTKKTAVRKSK